MGWLSRALTMNALDTMRALANEGEVSVFEAGEIVFRSGDSGDCMFGVLEGTVQLSWNSGTSHEEIKAGDVFGAGALVTADHRRYGEAKALTYCRLLVMNREKFLFAVQEAPMFAVELLGSIDERLRKLKDCIMR
jgi:CRP/FNR family transcriptional regulator, cyclic AMP receptor protein